MRPVAALVALLAAGSLAGCGGGTETYTLDKTRRCLAGDEQVLLIRTPKSDFVALNALGGSVAARVGENTVVISFGLDERGAHRIATAYRRLHGRNIGIADVLRPTGNAVLLWQAHPIAEDEETINDCLK